MYSRLEESKISAPGQGDTELVESLRKLMKNDGTWDSLKKELNQVVQKYLMQDEIHIDKVPSKQANSEEKPESLSEETLLSIYVVKQFLTNLRFSQTSAVFDREIGALSGTLDKNVLERVGDKCEDKNSILLSLMKCLLHNNDFLARSSAKSPQSEKESSTQSTPSGEESDIKTEESHEITDSVV